MSNFLFQVCVQGFIIVLVWAVVSRDVRNLRARLGTTPGSISAFAWGALCGLTWVAVVPYLYMRRRLPGNTAPTQERNLTGWWIVLALGAAVWASTDAARGDANNSAQHAILTVIFAACGLLAWSRDRKLDTASP